MEVLKRKRTIARTGFTKTLTAFNTLLRQSEASRAELGIAFRSLVSRRDDLKVCQEEVLESLMQTAEDDDLQKEYDESNEYYTKFVAAEWYYQERTAVVASSASKKTVRLSKIELVKFSGEVREWLRFWSPFKKIHDDKDITNEDKFQYLIQAMVPGSRAAKLVDSYPPIGENYEKAITSLKKRFGRDKLQIEIYVRELLQLMLQKVLNPKREVVLSSLYDTLKSHLRSLETLGVTTDKYATILFPLVESALPEELLRAWQRSDLSKDVFEDETDEAADQLPRLIKFLEAEVRLRSLYSN